MKVIFIKDLDSKNKKNDIKDVSSGYAINFLFPKKFAIPVTREKLEEVKSKNIKNQKEKDKEKEIIEKLSKKIQSLNIIIEEKANDEGHLFGSVDSNEISKILKEKHKLDIDKNKIDLPHHIKNIGEHKIPIKLSNNETPFLKVTIKNKSS
ncbi:MAG: 50S ribosomal protein L9 [Patescibacteria group bacterium]|nr:50S ribosomal protein L9 [Patescibacteria group bacterium]MDD4304298.1 50S ribosomal protein L9 [Patescibacteria group bacterium]MDD4695675.1 50S ribosomal protein L9 [Patescibacteria group bacterium]